MTFALNSVLILKKNTYFAGNFLCTPLFCLLVFQQTALFSVTCGSGKDNLQAINADFSGTGQWCGFYRQTLLWQIAFG